MLAAAFPFSINEEERALRTASGSTFSSYFTLNEVPPTKSTPMLKPRVVQETAPAIKMVAEIP